MKSLLPEVYAGRSTGLLNRNGHDLTRDYSPPSDYVSEQRQAVANFDQMRTAWNEAVANLASGFEHHSHQDHLATFYRNTSAALKSLSSLMEGDMILSASSPKHFNPKSRIEGHLDCFGVTLAHQNFWFMGRPTTYPDFPFFTIEPATKQSQTEANLVLLTNPVGVCVDEPNEPNTKIDLPSYASRSIVSTTLSLPEITGEAALLFNISAKGYNGAMLKTFWNGELALPAIPVNSTPDNPTPNFWVIVPWRAGTNVLDLKFVGAGYLWFDHVDVHHVMLG